MRIVDWSNLQVQLSAGEGDSEAGGNQSSVILGMDLCPGPKQARNKLSTNVLATMLLDLDGLSRHNSVGPYEIASFRGKLQNWEER